MLIQRIAGFTRILGKSQGYLGLPVRDVTMPHHETDEQIPCMETAWQPTPEELAALNAGANIHVRLMGQHHPPIMVSVGPKPEAI